MAHHPDTFSLLLKAFRQHNSSAFARALDAEKVVSPITARVSAEYMMLKMFTGLNPESARIKATEKMFVKATEVLAELAPILIFNDAARQSMKRSLMVADAISESTAGIGLTAIQKALRVLDETTPETALQNAQRAGVISLQAVLDPVLVPANSKVMP